MKVIAVVSGGIDSVSYMAYYWKKKCRIECLTFNYAQKGLKETIRLKEICKELRIGLREIDISFMEDLWKNTQLIDKNIEIKETYHPTVVVPIRNAVFLTIAFAYALSCKADRVIYGATTNDFLPDSKGNPCYPDCSPKFIKAIQAALHFGHKGKCKIKILSPSIEGLSKSENLVRGYSCIEKLIYKTWSCYLSLEKHCGKCESCSNRRKAFIKAGIPDETGYLK